MPARPASLLLLLALGAWPPTARAADAPAAGALTKAPVVATPAVPEYPDRAKALGLQGVVALEIEISETGAVTDAVVTEPAGHGFDEAAVAAARKLVFAPAEVDGKPSPVRIEYRFTFTLAAAVAEAAPPPVNLRGRALERGTREPVVGAQVIANGRRVHTGPDGRFEIAGVPEGEVRVRVEGTAHEAFEAAEQIRPGQATEVSYWLRRTAQDAYQAVVVGAREKREVAYVALSAGELKKVPGVSGDAVKVIQNLPGVARPQGGGGDLIVRGGNARDTRVYVDGHEVPQVFHFGGLTSVYSAELMKEVEFEAGNFGVRYGRAIGGRVNLVTRDPGDKTHALADVNLYHATALFEGQARENLNLAVAARRSYADAMVKAVIESQDDAPSITRAPRYYDLQTKLAWNPTGEDTVRLDLYGSDDRVVVTGIKEGGLRNIESFDLLTRFWAGSLRWRHRISPETRLELDLGGGLADYGTTVGDQFKDRERIPSVTGRAELHHAFSDRARVVAGVDGLGYLRGRIQVTAPPIPPAGQVPSPDYAPRRFDQTFNAGEAGAFVEATFEPADGLVIVPGVRADLHRTFPTLAWVDPRLAVRWQVASGTALKAAAGLYHQAPPIVYMTKEWGNPALTEEGAWQYAVGAEQRLFGKLSLDLQLYYKRLFDLALPTDATVVRDGRDVPQRFASAGTGRAYGAELLVRWDPGGRFFGWAAYSLSKTKRDQSVAGGRLLAEGDDFDQPHNLVLVGTWQLPELWDGLSAGFRARYGTGNPYERVRSAVYDADADSWTPITTGRKNDRMPDFFQLDLRVDRKWTFKTWAFTAYLELQNATNRTNAEGVAYSADYSQHGWMTGLPIFPAFGLRAEY